jgi:predicted DNA binding CopG/RHH family protein
MPVDIEKRNARQNAWQKDNKERINFLMDKGTKARIKQAADQEGIKPSEFIRNAIEKQLIKSGLGADQGKNNK